MADSTSLQANLRAALDSAHHILEGTMAGVTDEVANKPAPGRANPVGSCYAHAVIAEDAIVNGMLAGRAPLIMTTFAGRAGVDKPMPMPGMVEGDLGEWYHTAKVDVGACRDYAKAVAASAAEYISGADDATLNRVVDSPFGKYPLSVFFQIFVIGHLNSLAGEISAGKGAQGLQGYPF
jgi:DinB superfamily